jgi:GPH family glycoside/pentoside/hexuronide:cation symporter
MGKTLKPNLARYGFLAFPLAFLGMPLYIYLPKFYYNNYGTSLASLGVLLFFLRIFDSIIDPFLGFISDKYQLTQKRYLIIFGLGLIFFFNCFFHLPNFISPDKSLIWFGFCTIFVYLFFSLIFINYYNLGARIADTEKYRLKLVSIREFLGFLGMIVASVTPAILSLYIDNEIRIFVVYGILFGILIIFALYLLPKSLKTSLGTDHTHNNFISNFRYIYNQAEMRWLIILFFINSIPIAITANLFNFYVDDFLHVKNLTALFLILYLVSAALSAFLSSILFKSSNKIYILFVMMLISIIGFSTSYFLNESNYYLFYFVCVIAGLGLGGESVILSSLAADVTNQHSKYGNIFFALWSSVTKITLAIGAGVFLPLISLNSSFLVNISQEYKISFCYTIIPLIIKVISIIILILKRNQIARGA